MSEGGGCACEDAVGGFPLAERTEVGIDPTHGRFAEVTLDRCRSCGRAWLHYFVEYEAFSRSGRWARALIGDDEARAIAPETAAAYLDAAPWYVCGGSYFSEGGGGRRSGPIGWWS